MKSSNARRVVIDEVEEVPRLPLAVYVDHDPRVYDEGVAADDRERGRVADETEVDGGERSGRSTRPQRQRRSRLAR